MTQGEWALAVETACVGAARSQVLSDAFNRSQIGRAVIEAKFSSYATHKILTGFAVGECDWSVTREVQPFGSAQRRRCGREQVSQLFTPKQKDALMSKLVFARKAEYD
ncbi:MULTISPECIES: hypothetical protein [Stutzerimonas]|uniref:hypothetical protein n=1 Tax=Stutzerimonas TaxID=2901164 RepID=UPI001EE65639|nr:MULTISPECIES: hypothetical protein [Stutzerimonas stutzeri subgroup]MCQ2040126.1 hypothetical protein [Stutzerimonas kunmingensis]